jgi:hypothetical protein
VLRGAACDVLPGSVAERVKSPYPSTQEPHYTGALRRQFRALLEDGVSVSWTAHGSSVRHGRRAS